MKKLLLFFCFCIMGAGLMAQQQAQRAIHPQKAPMIKSFQTGFEATVQPVQPNLPPANVPLDFRETREEVIIGQTKYDLQSNFGNCNRIQRGPDGTIHTTWTLGNDDPNYSDRGTGYNMRNTSGAWNSIPSVRLEATDRTGWPNIVVLDDGTELICSHRVDGDGYKIHTLRREVGGSWAEGDVTTNLQYGTLWPRMANAGNYVYMVSIVPPTAFNEGLPSPIYEPYEGVDGHMLFYRSSDGGQSWDITDVVIPGIDSSAYADMNADSYMVDARDNVVAVAYFGDWGDVRVAKSTDYGETWTTSVVNDFPLDKYEINSGYTYDQLPPIDTLTDQPDSLAIFTSDQAGDVLIDLEGGVHVWFGRMWVQDDDLTDAGSSFYPTTIGIAYWNESFGMDSLSIAGDLLDLDGNGFIDRECDDLSCIASYFTSLTSHPSAAIAPYNGYMYLAYSAFMEGPDYYNEEDGQHYRHIYLTYSPDGGATWEGPIDVINETTIEDDDFVNFIEGTFPSLVPEVVGENLQLIYQQDFRPGLSVRGDEDPVAENFISYVEVGIEDFGLVGTEEAVVSDAFSMRLQPNPAQDVVQLAFELPTAAETEIRINNIMGQAEQRYGLKQLPAGVYQETLDVSNLTPGMYLIQLRVGDQLATTKLMVK